MLMNVTSARIDIKAAAARAERLLERYAEPLAAIHGGAWPERLLELAWRRVVDNSAHDSICGCSQDAVVDQVLTRFAEAEQIAARASSRPRSDRSRKRRPRATAVVVNPSPLERDRRRRARARRPRRLGRRRAGAPGTGARADPAGGAARDRPAPPGCTGGAGAELFARRLHGRELFGHSLDGHLIGATADRPELILLDGRSAPDRPTRRRALLDAVRGRDGRGPDEAWEIASVRGDRRRLAGRGAGAGARRDGRPGGRGSRPGSADALDGRPTRPVVAIDERSLDNGLVADRRRRRRHVPARRRRGRASTASGGSSTAATSATRYNYGPPAEDGSSRRPSSRRRPAGRARADPRQARRSSPATTGRSA